MNDYPSFCKCPRCGDYGFENLKTYGHCVNCLYVSDYEDGTSLAKVIGIESALDLSDKKREKNEATKNIEFSKEA